MSRDVTRQIAGVVTLAAVLLLNGVAGSGALSGDSIGVIANQDRSYFLPASYVFSIWSIIYLLLTVFVVYQSLPSRRDQPVLRRIGWWWPVNGALNSAWVVLFSFGLFGSALAVMVMLLVSLARIHTLVGPRRELEKGDRLAVAVPFELYLAWISVALIANSFQVASAWGWDGLSEGAVVWAVAMMLVATTVGAFMATRRGVWVYPLVVAWALAGIAVRYDQVGALSAAAWTLTALGLLFAAVAGRWPQTS